MFMPKNVSKKIPSVERMLKILEYLKWNTDSNHPTSQMEMRSDPSISEYISHKETFHRLIKNMTSALNAAETAYKDEKDWKICFDAFKKLNSQKDDDSDNKDLDNDDSDDNKLEPQMRIRNLYYNRTFSYDEIDRIIEGIYSIKTLDSKSADVLIKKVEDNLTTKFYKKGPKNICKVMEPELVDRETLKNNLLTIQKAIDNGKKVAFIFNGYSRDKKLIPIRHHKDIVSPYYIVANSGKYYLLACKEITINDEVIKKMSIWRIDFMSKIEIPDFNYETSEGGYNILPKREVQNLPIQWNDKFQLEHLNMAFDEPVDITLKITNIDNKNGADYTFLHDWFGNNFRFRRSEDNIVEIKCSPYAMTHWALQYSDRVEVLEPIDLRNQIIEKIKALNTKYKIN